MTAERARMHAIEAELDAELLDDQQRHTDADALWQRASRLHAIADRMVAQVDASWTMVQTDHD